MSFRGFLWVLAGLTPVYLVLAAVLPPLDDELYYWCWSEQLQLSYYDHPPMTAYMIRAATTVFGDTLFAIRLPAVVSTLTVLAVIGWLTRPRDLLPFVIFTPLFTFGAVLVTPDTPLLMFWALYVAWLVMVHERLTNPGAGRQGFEQVGMAPVGRAVPDILVGRAMPDATGTLSGTARPTQPGCTRPHLLWLLGGLILGCGILGKYTTGLAVIAGFLSFATAVPVRKWAWGYAAHLAVAFVVTLPILIHNLRYDFVPLMYQWKHSMSSPRPGLLPFFEFAGIQLLLFGALPFGVFAWTLLRRRELLPEPRLRVCAWLFGFPFAFFLFKATRGPLEGNWALACYIAVWPLAAKWYESVKASAAWRRLTAAAFGVPATCVILIAVHLVHPLPVPNPGADRITRQSAKDDLAVQLAGWFHDHATAGPVFVPSYQWTALLRFHHLDARQVADLSRPSHFTQNPQRPADHDHVYVFAEGFLPAEFVEGFGPPRIIQKFPLMVRGQEVGVFWLLEYSRSQGSPGVAVGQPPPGRLDQPASAPPP